MARNDISQEPNFSLKDRIARRVGVCLRHIRSDHLVRWNWPGVFGAVLVVAAFNATAPLLITDSSFAETIITPLTGQSAWTAEDRRSFFDVSEGMSVRAGEILRKSGWTGRWNAGSTRYSGTNDAYLEIRTKAEFTHPTLTGGARKTLYVRATLVRSAEKARAGAVEFGKAYEQISAQSTKTDKFRLVDSQSLGLGEDSGLFTVEITPKLGQKRTLVAAYFVKGNWFISIDEARDVETVKAAIHALARGLDDPETTDQVGGGASVSPPEPIVKPDPATGTEARDNPEEDPDNGVSIKDRLAGDEEGQLKDFEQFFYRVEIPQDKRLVVFESPALNAPVMVRLLPDAGDLRVLGLQRAAGLLWANLCAGNQCGWALAKYLHRQSNMPPEGGGNVEVAFPEVNVFMDPSVESWRVSAVHSGERFTPTTVVTDDNGETWIRICGTNWCGWAASEFFARVK
jgi:hypothetical protein